jgi:hypothetical protein
MQNRRLISVIFFAAVAGAIGASSETARAEDNDTLWVRENLLKNCKRHHNCGKFFRNYDGQHYSRVYYRPSYPERYRRFSEHVRYEERERDYRNDRDYRRRDGDRDRYDRDGDFCKGIVVSTGHEAYGRTKAKEEGEQAWMEETKSKYGARYMDLRNARRVSYECYRSSTGNRASEKAQDVVGRFLEQCRIEARACRADKEYANEDRERDANVSRNLEEDENRKGRLFRRLQEWRRKRQDRLNNR